MGTIIDAWNQVAAVWWPYVWQATWQGSLATALVLAVLWCWRKMPSPVRYALLLVALVKFILPPTWAAPTGLYGYLSPSPPASAAVDRPSTGPRRAVPQVALAAPVDPQPDRPGLSVRAEADFVADPPGTRNESAVPRFVWGKTLGTVGHVGGRSWLMLLHLAGCMAAIAWVLLRALWLQRIWRAARPLAAGPLFDRFVQTARQMGIQRGVSLRVCPETVVPMAFGLFRPRVLLPTQLLNALDQRQLAAVLAHELAHQRRRDPWIGWLQIVVAIAWWFNPVVWVLNRAIRRTQEDCCDDLVLHDRLAGDTTYCEALVRTAEVLAQGELAARSFGFAQAMHPLGHRIQRAMDTTRNRAPCSLPAAKSRPTTRATSASLTTPITTNGDMPKS